MAIGDITYASDKDYVDLKVNTEEETRAGIDTNYTARLDIVDPIINHLLTSSDADTLGHVQTYLSNVSHEINLNLGAHMSSNEYTTSPINLEYFPNLPSNDLKSIYYTDFVNLSNALSKKMDIFLKSIKSLTFDLSQDANYIKLQNLINAKMPLLKTKVSRLTAAVNTNNDTFVEMVAQIKAIKKDSVAQIMVNSYAKVDNLSPKVQYNNTPTKYYDATNKKYYRLFIENGKVAIQESLAPGSIIFSMISMASLFFITYNQSINNNTTQLEEKLNLYHADYHRTIGQNIYVIKKQLLYIYNLSDMRLKARILINPHFQTIIPNLNDQLINDGIIVPNYLAATMFTTNEDKFSTLYMHETSNSKLLFIGETVSPHIMCINLEKLNTRIDALGTTIMYDNLFLTDPTNYVMINVLGEDSVRILLNDSIQLPENIDSNGYNTLYYNFLRYGMRSDHNSYINNEENFNSETFITSIDYDETLNVLFVALARNFIFSFQIDCKVTKLEGDGETFTSYTSSYTYDNFFRAGVDVAEQNSTFIRAIKFNRTENRMYLATYGYINYNDIHNISYVNIATVDKPMINILNVSQGSFLLHNNVCQLSINKVVEDVSTYTEYIVNSDISGHLNYQYFWKNTKYLHDKFFKPDQITSLASPNTPYHEYSPSLSDSIGYMVSNSYVNDTRYMLDTTIVVGSTQRYLFLVHKVMSRNAEDLNVCYKHCLKIYDKVNNFYAYDTTNYMLTELFNRNNSQISIDNLPAIKMYKPAITQSSNRYSMQEDLTLVNAKVTKASVVDPEIELIFESALNREDTYINGEITYHRMTTYGSSLPSTFIEYKNAEQKRNAFTIKCKFNPTLL